MDRTIRGEWQSFKEFMLPDEAEAFSRRDMRISFLAGVLSSLRKIEEADESRCGSVLEELAREFKELSDLLDAEDEDAEFDDDFVESW